MFPSLRFMLAAVLSTLVILVIGSSALVSMRRPEIPVVLHPAGSRPLAATWQNDDMRSFDARFAAQTMLINASVQLPPVDRSSDRPSDRQPSRLEFVGSANAAVDAAKTLEPAKPVALAIPDDTAALAATRPTPTEPPVAVAVPVNVTPPVIVSPATESVTASVAASPSAPATAPRAAPSDETKPAVVANVDAAALDTPKPEAPIVVAAISPVPTPAKDPQIATDAPALSTDKTAAILPAEPDVSRPTFVDTSRPERIVKPAVKRRAQIKRPKKRVARTPAPAAKPATPTNPFAALFGSSSTP